MDCMRQDYHKLVRDRIPELIARDGHTCAVEPMTEAEYRQALPLKVVEEAQELAAATTLTEQITELADLLEAIAALMQTYGIDPEAVTAQQEQRRSQRGGFEQRLKLLWVERGSLET